MSGNTKPSLALLAVDFPPSSGGIQTLTWEIYSRLADLTRIVVAPASEDGAEPLFAGVAPAATPSRSQRLGGPGDGRSGARLRLLAGDARSAHDISKLPPSGEPGQLPSGLPITRTRRASGQGWHTLLYLHEAAGILSQNRQRPLLLHCNHLFAGYAGWWLRRRYGIPYLVWVHGEELSKNRHAMAVRASLGSAAAILTNSDFTADLVRRQLHGKTVPPIHKISLGAPKAWLEAPLPAPTATPGLPVILTVARLSRRDRYKGVDTALRAMAVLRRRGFDFRYRIVGDGDDRAFLEKAADTAGVADRVEFLGRVATDRLMALYDGCDIFLLCSREEPSPRGLGFEGFGIVFLEAGARGKPVLGGRSGGIPDAVAEGESGLLVDPDSPDAIADGLQRLLVDPALRARLGSQGGDRVRARFHWDEAAAQVRTVHRQLTR